MEKVLKQLVPKWLKLRKYLNLEVIEQQKVKNYKRIKLKDIIQVLAIINLKNHSQLLFELVKFFMEILVIIF
jgi:hypothetical protein